MTIISGKTTILKSTPGVKASKTVSVPGATSSSVASITIAQACYEYDNRLQLPFYAIYSTDELTIYCDDDQLRVDTEVYYFVESTPSISVLTPQSLALAGAVDTTSEVTLITTAGAIALTLDDGVEGQIKHIVCISYVGDATLTPTNLLGGDTITFGAEGETATLLFTNDAWVKLSGIATLA